MTSREASVILKQLVGSGDRIGLLVLPILLLGVILNVLFPSLFAVGGPPGLLAGISVVVLVPGIAVWLWTVVLILKKAPKQELITDGPYSLVKRPLYTGLRIRPRSLKRGLRERIPPSPPNTPPA